MEHRTITALYDTRAAAEEAKKTLSGIGVSSVDIHDEATVSNPKPAGGLIEEVKHIFGMHDDAHAYSEGLRRGRVLLTAKVGDENTEEAIRLLEDSGAVDIDEEQTDWQNNGWTAPTAMSARDGDDTIDIVKETLVVGKREVERGGVRVRSYVVETPVQQSVSLRDEHVDVDRRAVNRPVTGTDDAFRERTIEMRATGEEAVVGKQAVVTEEVSIRKDVGERTEEVRDTVRHTEVEVERLAGNSQDRLPGSSERSI